MNAQLADCADITACRYALCMCHLGYADSIYCIHYMLHTLRDNSRHDPLRPTVAFLPLAVEECKGMAEIVVCFVSSRHLMCDLLLLCCLWLLSTSLVQEGCGARLRKVRMVGVQRKF